MAGVRYIYQGTVTNSLFTVETLCNTDIKVNCGSWNRFAKPVDKMLLITWRVANAEGGGGMARKQKKGKKVEGKNKQDFVYSLINHEYQLSKGGKIMELSYSDENGKK